MMFGRLTLSYPASFGGFSGGGDQLADRVVDGLAAHLRVERLVLVLVAECAKC